LSSFMVWVVGCQLSSLALIAHVMCQALGKDEQLPLLAA